MAATEDSSHPQSSLPIPQQTSQQSSSTVPPYPDLIMSAIEALNDKNGSNKSAISKQIETTYPDLPAAHTALLSHHLNKMKQSGQLVLVKNNYMKPDNAPPKRGRGRPPKPKTPLPPGTVVSPPRPRGRPPKPKDPFAPISPPKKKTSGGSTGRPRGRPSKKAKTTASAPPASSSSAATGEKRGRGRPPKVKPTITAS